MTVKARILAAAAVVTVAAVSWPFATTIWTGLIRAAQVAGVYFGVFAVAAVLTAVLHGALLAASARSTKARAFAWLPGVAALATVGVIVGLFVVGGYNRVAWHYDDHVTFTDDPLPGFELREPYVVADELLRRNAGQQLSNVTVHDAMLTSDDADWGTAVDGRGWFQPTQAVLVKDGRDYRVCEMPGLDRALSGNFANSVKREINKMIRGTGMAAEDVAVDCDDGKGRVYVTLWEYNSWVQPVRVPAGVVEIDADGEYELHTGEIAPGDFDVPVVPHSPMRSLMNSVHYLDQSGGVVDRAAVVFRSRLDGFELPEGASRMHDRGVRIDAEDGGSRNPAAATHSEMLLRDSDGRPWYVTPLTPMGDNERITAVAVAPADEMTTGQPPEVTVHRLDSDRQRLSNREVNDRLRAAFDAVVPWEAGYEVYEITPYRDGTWSAAIGQRLEVPYRAIVDPDGQACLYRSDAEAVTDLERLACTPGASDTARALAEAADDEIVVDEDGDAAAAGDGDDAPVDVDAPLDVGRLSDEELAELLEAIGEELRRRSE